MPAFKTAATIMCLLIVLIVLSGPLCAVAGPSVDDCGYPVAQVPAACGNTSCHVAPPVKGKHGPHPGNNRCYRCHGMSIDSSFQPTKLHNNKTVDYAVGCSSCHGWNQGVSPPQNLKGECGQGLDGVGAHKAMRMSAIPVHQVACSNCHVVPLSTWAEGHIDGDGKAEVVFSGLAKAGGSQPAWDGTTSTCENVYCHGATLKGGDYKKPDWKDTSGKASRCGACHHLADHQSGTTATDCSACHPGTVAKDGTILPYGDHINGFIEKPGANK